MKRERWRKKSWRKSRKRVKSRIKREKNGGKKDKD